MDATAFCFERGNMTREFPHLKGATNFPSVTVKAYQQYRNDRNYDDYTGLTRLKVCSVPWTADTTDRVKWDSDAARNDFFDNLTGDVFEGETIMANIIDGQPIKLPIPWASAQYANYLMVIPSDLPGNGDDLDNSENRTNRVFYFVVATSYVSPSVTECTLIRDDWTTFINHVRIPRIALERGHQATTYATPSEFLKNPLNNTQGLTDKEPNAPLEPDVCAKNEWIPLATGEQWCLFAIKINFTRLPELRKAGDASTSSAPTFSNSSAEWGAAYNVDSFIWGGVPDVATVETPFTTLASGSGTLPTGYDVLAFPASQINDVVLKINKVYPQVWNLIGGCWIVPRTMFDTTSLTWNLDDITVYQVKLQSDKSLGVLTFKPTDFAYDKHYASLTKLYTKPYAWLDITNGDTGESAKIYFENISQSLTIDMRVSNAFPYLKAQTFLRGVSGNNDLAYKWQALNEAQSTIIPASAWRMLTTHEIPTYTLFADNATLTALNGISVMRDTQRENAINAYHAAQRGTNIAQINTKNANATNLSNATASATTALANSTASANTAESNTSRSSQTSIDNTESQTDWASEKTGRISQFVNAQNLQMTGNATALLKLQNDKMNTDYSHTTNLMRVIESLSADTAVRGSLVSGGSRLVSGAINTVAAGNGGGVLAGATAAVDIATSAINLSIMLQKNHDVNTAQIENMLLVKNDTQYNNANVVQQNLNNTTALQKLQLDYNGDVNVGENKLATTITAKNASTANANATASKNTAISNATASKNTAISNATASKNTGDNVADKSRDSATFANQIALINAQNNWDAKIADAKRAAPTVITTPNGDAIPDTFGLRGIQVRVMTQAPDVIRRCGDAFLQFGYTWHANIENPTLNLKRNYTFWQGTPTLIPENAPAQAISTIRELFETGVTIWREPDKIGSSIYNNEE